MAERKVSAGTPFFRDPPSASMHNDTLDMLRLFRLGRDPLQGVNGHSTGVNPALTCNIKNNSGSDLTNRFGVLGIDDVLYNETDNLEEFNQNFALVGITPDVDEHRGNFCIVQELVENGNVGVAVFDGLTRAKVNILHASHLYCDVADAEQTKLESNVVGTARILYKPTGTGDKDCLIRLNESSYRKFPAKVVTTISAATYTSGVLTPGSGTVTPQATNASGDWEDSGSTETVYNWTNESSEDPASYDVFIWVTVNCLDGKPYLTAEPCEHFETAIAFTIGDGAQSLTIGDNAELLTTGATQ